MNLSIIIPLLNEEESLPELLQWIVKIMTVNNYSYEVIFIDDESNDNSWQIIKQLSPENPNVKGIHFQRNFGKSQALHAGFAKAQGDVVITMDADGEDLPVDVAKLITSVLNHSELQSPIAIAQRIGREESVKFRILYFFFKTFFKIMTGSKIKSGNFK